MLDPGPEVSEVKWVFEHSCRGRKVTSEKMIFMLLIVILHSHFCCFSASLQS